MPPAFFVTVDCQPGLCGDTEFLYIAIKVRRYFPHTIAIMEPIMIAAAILTPLSL